MDRAPSDYTQSDHHPSAAHYVPAQQEVPSNSYSTSATPTSDYGVGYPGSARSGSFPEHHLQARRYHHPSSNHSGSSGGMAQPHSPSISLPDGRQTHHQNQMKSDQDVPLDPSIAASSPTYPHGYAAYPQQQEMQHGYAQHPNGALYNQPRPDWAGYGGSHHGMPTYQTTSVSTPTSAAPASVRGPAQVYSFVPIPGAQQHKRPRRRYEEIERMYKCGWNGCEKAYGTLNHLNAHVTMQSHGAKRTPEEFKEIRKEWKARKKDEENQRKEQDERSRSAAAAAAAVIAQNGNGHAGGPADGDPVHQPTSYQGGRSQVQLPPIGYQPGAQVPVPYQQPAATVEHQIQSYPPTYGNYPPSPYTQQSALYSQPNNGNGNGNPNGNGRANTPAPKYEQH